MSRSSSPADDAPSARSASAEPGGRRPRLLGAEAGASSLAPEKARRRQLAVEVLLVLGVSLGASALYALLSFLQDLQSGVPLSHQAAVLNASVPGAGSALNLTYQLVGIGLGLVPVGLVAYLLALDGSSLRAVGIDRRPPPAELGIGALLAAGVGGIGLGFYLLAYHLGFDVKVVPTTLPAVWWRIPVLLLSAFQNGLLEEAVVCAYLLRRLDVLGWAPVPAVLGAAVLRGTYHLYQGVGGFVGNLAMGVLFGALYRRSGKATRIVVAHSLIDAGAFVGYVLLKGHVSWIP